MAWEHKETGFLDHPRQQSKQWESLDPDLLLLVDAEGKQ
jgi:hypothetical protein